MDDATPTLPPRPVLEGLRDNTFERSTPPIDSPDGDFGPIFRHFLFGQAPTPPLPDRPKHGRNNMQNRITIANIPGPVAGLPNALETLRDLVEEHGAWVDRFAFLGGDDGDDTSSSAATAAAEYHLENVRDRAVASLDGLAVRLDPRGDRAAARRPAAHAFRLRARAATADESAGLLRSCPVDEGDGVDEHAVKKMAEQRLALPSGVELTVRRSRVGGGTGAVPWKGGVILASRVCSWSGRPGEDIVVATDDGDESPDDSAVGAETSFDSLFRGKNVLELGAGAAALPSMALGRLAENGRAECAEVTASDGIDEIVEAMGCNVRANGLDGLVKVRHVNWNDYLDGSAAAASDGSVDDDDHREADTILFADCIYNDDCAVALCRAIERLLSPGGRALGVLPLFRAGIDVFRKLMDNAGFEAVNVPLVSAKGGGGGEDGGISCFGGGDIDYDMILWRRRGPEAREFE